MTNLDALMPFAGVSSAGISFSRPRPTKTQLSPARQQPVVVQVSQRDHARERARAIHRGAGLSVALYAYVCDWSDTWDAGDGFGGAARDASTHR
jgi:hypothetical protein